MQNIDEVLVKLEEIVAECRQQNATMGYFAALYYQMTAAVKQGITSGVFADATRMEKLDVIFAQRYIDAYQNFKNNGKTTKAWQVAFEASTNPKITVIQHLLLGINAHINLDLGIAAAATAPQQSINDLKADFMKINDTIKGLIDKTQDKLSEIWWAMALLDYFLKSNDEGLVNFSIKIARTFSWQSAQSFAFADGQAYQNKLKFTDQAVSKIARKILSPDPILSAALWAVRKAETGTVADKIDVLFRENISTN